MLAFQLPIPLGYDPAITVGSLGIAIVASAFALKLVCQEHLPRRRLVMGALVLGAAVASMPLPGMAALRMPPGIRYVPWLFVLSIVIAVGASGVALWIAFRLRRNMPRIHQLRLGAAVVMGGAIAAMHYTGMAARGFRSVACAGPPGTACTAARWRRPSSSSRSVCWRWR